MHTEYRVIPKPDYLIYEIREIQYPDLNIWSLQTMSYPCSKDGKGRSRLLLLDYALKKVLGIYLGGRTSAYYLVTPLPEDITDRLSQNIPWDSI